MKRKNKRLSPTPSSNFDPTKFGMLAQQSAKTPTQAQDYRDERVIPSNMYEPPREDPEDPESELIEDDRIIEQARALRNNVDLIYEFVHDQIEFLPTYGLHKGGLGCLIDGSGNAFDQSDLMVRLLRKSGYTANFVLGLIELEDTQWSNWLGIDLEEQNALTLASQLLANGGIGHTVDTQTDKIKLEHCWVQVTIGQTEYVFDPSFKAHANTTGITNLEDAILGENVDISDFLVDAKDGSSPSTPTDYVQNINDANITSNLTAYCNNLIEHIQDNMPGAGMNEVLGGRSIVSIVGEDAVRDTELDHEDQGTTPSVVEAIPDKSKAIMLVQYDWSGTHYRIEIGFFSSDIYSKRQTLWFDENRMARLYIDGEVVDGPSAQMPAGEYSDLIITITHPYASDFADAEQRVPIRTGGQTIIGNAWGVSTKDMASIHQLIQNEAVAAGTQADAENMLGISLLLVWDNFIGQASLGLDMLSRMAKCNSVLHHFVGVISHQTYGTARRNSINTFLGGWNSSKLVDSTDTPSVGVTSSMLFQVLESAAHQQVSGVVAADIIKAITVANAAGTEIYDAKASNWSGVNGVRATMQGVGYDSDVLDAIEEIFIDGSPAWHVAMPKDATITIGDTTDFYGYLAVGPTASDTTVIGQTWFGAKGSVSTGDQDDASTNGAASDNARQVNGFGMPSVTAYESARVNMLNGRYEYSSTDMTVGNQGAPYELSFTRSYNSALRLTFQDMGFGWCHNWQMKASENSDGFIPFGDQQVLAAVPAIVALFVTRQIAAIRVNNAMPIENIVTSCIVQDFLAKQLVDNVVRLQFGGSFLVFTKMYDGCTINESSVAYLPPMGMHLASKLEKLLGDPEDEENEEDHYFVFTTAEKVAHTYRTNGLILSIAYPFGIDIDFEYEGTNERLVRVTNGFRELNFEYDLYNQLNTVNDGNSRSVQLTIDYNTGNLTAVSDPLPVSNTHYEYDQRGRMTAIKKSANPNDPIVTNIYDSLSRVKEQEDAYGNLWQFFLAGSRSEEVAPPVSPAVEGTSRTLYFNKRGSTILAINALGQSVTTEYDGNERAVLVTMPEGNGTSTVYDKSGNVISVTQHAKPGSGLSARTTSFAYGDENWPSQPDEITDPATKVTSKTFDATTGKVTQITLEEVDGGTPTSTFEYNSIGQVTRTAVKVEEAQEPEDDVWLVTENSFEVDGQGNPTGDRNLLSTIVDPDGKAITTSFSYDDVGNVLTTTDPNGNVTTAAYNANRWVTQVTGPAPFNQVAYVTYDDNGNVIETRSLASTDPNTQVTTKTYAIDGKVLTVTGPVNFGQAAQPIPVRYEYDEMRRLKSVTDPQGHVATTVFDAISRPVSSAFDGVTLKSVTYTANGKVASVTDAEDNTTEYLFDGFDRPVTVTYPDDTTEEVTYDVRDNVLAATTRAGLEYTFVYDALSRLSSKTPYGQPEVSFTYDLAGRTLTVSVPVVSGDPSTGTFSMAYDSAGRMIQETCPDGKTVTASSLDANGNVLTLQYPDQSEIENTFDELDRVTGISGFGATVSFAYDSASRRSSQSNGNGTGQGYWYDRVDNLASTIIGGLKPNQSLATSPRVELAYGTNDAGQTVSKTCNDSAFLWQPNVVEMHTTQYGQANNLNQYPSVENDDFVYDDNGCLTNDGTNTYAYDHESRLVSVTTGSGTVSFKYDPFGRLLLKTVGSNKFRYLYSGMQRIEEYNGNTGSLLKRYVWGAGLDECLFVVDAATSDVTYLHSDETGSTVLTTDETGTPINRNVYSPWGELASGSLSDISVGFTGQFYEPEVGLYFYKARHYAPKLGRFLQPDPIGYKGGLNLYEYCGSDPLNLSDPLGFGPDAPPGGGFSGLLEGAARKAGELVWDKITGDGKGSSAPPPGLLIGAAALQKYVNDLMSQSAETWAPPDYMPPPVYLKGKVSLEDNVELARQHPRDLVWLYGKVGYNADWDFKHHFKNTKEVQDYGNWHYGVILHEAGIPLKFAKQAAGIAQVGKYFADELIHLGNKNYRVTRPGPWWSNFDHVRDQHMIEKGWKWADMKFGPIQARYSLAVSAKILHR